MNAAEEEAASMLNGPGRWRPTHPLNLLPAPILRRISEAFIAAQNLLDLANPPHIMSLSYSECETFQGPSGNAYMNGLWQQAAVEGVSVFVSAGDGGAAGCDNVDRLLPIGRWLALRPAALPPHPIMSLPAAPIFLIPLRARTALTGASPTPRAEVRQVVRTRDDVERFLRQQHAVRVSGVLERPIVSATAQLGRDFLTLAPGAALPASYTPSLTGRRMYLGSRTMACVIYQTFRCSPRTRSGRMRCFSACQMRPREELLAITRIPRTRLQIAPAALLLLHLNLPVSRL